MSKEILLFNYWEHIKAEKELSFILPPTDSRRIKIHAAAGDILKKLNSEPNDERSVATEAE